MCDYCSYVYFKIWELKKEQTIDQILSSIMMLSEIAIGKRKPDKNEVVHGRGFYLSYNPCTSDIGEEETALCFKDGSFWILNGDYRKKLKPLIKKGVKACKAKFMQLLKSGAEESGYSTRS